MEKFISRSTNKVFPPSATAKNVWDGGAAILVDHFAGGCGQRAWFISQRRGVGWTAMKQRRHMDLGWRYGRRTAIFQALRRLAVMEKFTLRMDRICSRCLSQMARRWRKVRGRCSARICSTRDAFNCEINYKAARVRRSRFPNRARIRRIPRRIPSREKLPCRR